MNPWLCASRAVLFVGLGSVVAAGAQTEGHGTIGGTVFDPSNAAIPHATVQLRGPTGMQDTVADDLGRFSLDVPPGSYELVANAPGFRTYTRAAVTVVAGRSVVLKVKLEIAEAAEEVNVPSQAGASTDADSNRSAIVFKGDALNTLSDDPSIMQQELQAVAGTDPTNPPQMYVDGFSNGTMPPKESIREIQINQNPFSAQYDQFGMGRIEVFTKPGSDKLHGNAAVDFGNDALDARNPYVQTHPAYTNSYLTGDVDGPLGKKSSFFVSGQYSALSENAIVNAVTLDSNLNQVTVSESLPNQMASQTYSARFDRQLGAKDTFNGRYTFNYDTQPNLGVGLMVLPSEASSSEERVQTLQLTDSHIFNAKVILDQGFQYIRTRTRQDAGSGEPAVVVQGAFSGGGSPSQLLNDNLDRFELQEYFSISAGKHFIRTGLRYRLTRDANLATAGSNGQYIFPDIDTYQRARMDVAGGLSGQEIAARGDGPTQFSLSAGRFNASLITGDMGAYAEDEWKATPNLTLNYGVRVESQSAIPDHFDLAPRLGGAYAVKLNKKEKAPVAVVRGGFGIFYQRFASSNILQTLRQNGTTEQTYYVANPTFYVGDDSADLPSLSELSATPPTVYEISPHLRSPIQMQGLVTVEHSFGKHGSMAVNYTQRRVTHQWESLNINAPLPETGVRPQGGDQNVYQYGSEGVISSHQLSVNANLNAGQKLMLWTFAGAGHVEADAFGPGTFATNSYDLRADRGPYPGFVPRQIFLGAHVHPAWGVTLDLFVAARAHSYFNITTGQDNNGDSIYNDRPSFATDLTRSSVVRTAYGNFDTDTMPGQTIIPMNYGKAPGMALTELALSKDFSFGPRAAAPSPPAGQTAKPTGKKAELPPQKYRLELGVWALNALNHVNPGPPVGVLSSPLFGKSISLGGFSGNSAANRTLTLRAAFFF